MGFYLDGQPPPHSHRTPCELAEDEIFATLHGSLCAMPERFKEAGPNDHTECVRRLPYALVRWADAHPSEPLRPK